jgi:RHS repeat-associated protein
MRGTGGSSGRWLAGCLVCCVTGMAGAVGLVGSPAVASSGASSSAVTGAGSGGFSVSGAPSSLGGALVIAGSPVQGEQARAAERARRDSPEARIAREKSRTVFEHLNAGQAAKVAGEAFPGVIDEPAGGSPRLPTGERITGYVSDNAAQVDLPGGKHGVIESAEPLAVETSRGHREPVDLGLANVGSAFAPVRSSAGLRIPRRLADGVRLANTGVSLTPVGANGSAPGGAEGVLDGASVLYANTLTDSDTVVRPLASGFEEDTLLRSVDSPSQIAFRVGLPAGASLVSTKGGAVKVVDAETVVASVLPPSAQDAEGTPVPVSMSVSGDMLTLTVDHRSGSYKYPIAVDPTVIEKEKWYPWTFVTENKENGFCGEYVEQINGEHSPDVVQICGTHKGGEDGAFLYTTQGESRIERYGAKTWSTFPSGVASTYMWILHSHFESEELKLPTEEGWHEVSATKEPSNGNTAAFEVVAESPGGSEKGFSQFLDPEVTIEQEAGPHVSMNTTQEVVNGEKNALYGNRWASVTTGKWGFEANASDPGLGVESGTSSSPNKANWGWTVEEQCNGVQCPTSGTPEFALKGTAEQLPEGEDSIEVKVKDPVGLEASTGLYKVKIDNAPPHNLTLSGVPSTHEISDGQHFLLKASATSGLAGMASVALTMDGVEVGTPSKGCSSRECTASGEWTLSGESYAAGTYTLAVVATDNAGNVTTKEESVTIHHAGDVSVGPGSVSPTTGELALNATDVSIGAPGATLTVGRSYRSRHPGVAAESPFGQQWGLSLGASESLSRTPGGGMVLTGSSGEQSVFTSNGKGGYTSPPGDAGLVLTEQGSKFLLSENGTVTTFTVPGGGSGGVVWEPSISEGAGGTNAITYAYQTVEVAGTKITEPTKELAPVPAGVSCSPTLNKGCRALKFVYATETTAKGNGPSEWGEYIGRLKEVTYTAYEPSSKEMKTKAVTHYVYDKQGRLRAEWNPQISPEFKDGSELKTVYGYDEEGHVTALAAAGQQPWLIEQGTTTSDASPGRVLAFARPAATTEAALKTEMEEPAPAIKTAPTLSSTTPTVGVKISVNLTSEKTPGTWSNSPLAYSYQWEDCNTKGEECTTIPGAVNQSYYPVASDEGHTLAAEVVALNADGAVTASSAVTSKVAAGTPDTPLPEPPSVGSLSVWTLDYQVPRSGSEPGLPKMSATEVAKWGQTDVPEEAMAVFPPDTPMGWPAKEYTRASIYYLDGRDRDVNFSSPTGGVSTTEYNLFNDVIRTLSPDNRATALAAGEAKSKEVSKELDSESRYNGETKEEQEKEEKEVTEKRKPAVEPGTALLESKGPQHTIELTNGTKAEGREHTVYSYNEGAPAEGGPYHLVTTMTEGAQIAGTEEPASVRTTKTSYSGQGGLGWKLRKPTSVTVNPGGLNLTHAMVYEAATGNVIETRMPAAEASSGEAATYIGQIGSEGTEKGKLKGPHGIAIDAKGNMWIADTANDRIDEFNEKLEFVQAFGWGVNKGEAKLEVCTTSCKAGTAGSGSGELKEPQGVAVTAGGDVYVADTANNRVEEFTEKGAFVAAFGFKVGEGEKEEFEICTGSKCKAGTAGSGNGQFKEPRGIAAASSGAVWVADTGNSRVEGFSSANKYLYKYGSAGKETEDLKDPDGVTIDSAGHVWIADSENNRVEELTSEGKYIGKVEGTGTDKFYEPTDVAFDSSGDLWLTTEDDVMEFSSTGGYLGRFGKLGSGNGQFKQPWGIAIDPKGHIWVSDVGADRVQEFANEPAKSAHEMQTIYYSAAANSEFKNCGEHPEWANLPCQTQPAAQPKTSSLPGLPVTAVAYNIWDEPETTTETVEKGTEKTTRTKTATYDPAGRLKTAGTSSTVGKAVPTVTDEYNEKTGALAKQCANEGKTCGEGKPKTITSAYNTLGELTSYTDAAEATTTYEYEGEGSYKGAKELDGRLRHVNDGKGTETLTYSGATGLLTELLNEYGTTKLAFTGTYDVEGNLLTEGYPNGMTATYTYNQTGKPTALVYKKISNCTEEEKEKCKWFKDTVVPSIHGQWLEQTSTLSHQAYTYDAAGRLTQVQNTPVGKGCTTHVYEYDVDTNRTDLKTYEPGTEGKCATEKDVEEKHTYDEADRLTDTGVKYSEFGNITALPATDAGGKEASEELTSEYYVDNQLSSQTQNGQTIGYSLDPAGRTLETVATGKRAETVTNHYAGPGSAPAWTVNTAGEATRNISGLSGFAAVQDNGATPVLQLTNLHGDIIATAYLSETATALASSADTSEFGVPTTSLPPKYSWLGADEIPTELPSGVLDMGARSYVPQLGRFLQPDPIPGGSANAYTYTFGDPVNTSDPSGESTVSELLAGFAAEVGHEAELAREVERAAEEAAARKEAEGAALEAYWAAYWAAGPQWGGGEEWGEEEWWEEEGEYEYVSYKHGAGPEGGEAEVHVENAVLVQPLSDEADSGEGTEEEGSASVDRYRDVRGNGNAFGLGPAPARRVIIRVRVEPSRQCTYGGIRYGSRPPYAPIHEISQSAHPNEHLSPAMEAQLNAGLGNEN